VCLITRFINNGFVFPIFFSDDFCLVIECNLLLLLLLLLLLFEDVLLMEFMYLVFTLLSSESLCTLNSLSMVQKLFTLTCYMFA